MEVEVGQKEGETLFFGVAGSYDKRSVDRDVQKVAIDKMFDYILYDRDGPMASRCTVVVDFTDFGLSNVDLVGVKLGIVTYLSYFPDIFNCVLLVNYPRLLYGGKLLHNGFVFLFYLYLYVRVCVYMY